MAGKPVERAALVLSGGGAYGAYEVGVVRALFERRNLNPAVYVGTSVGSFNAAVLATNEGGPLSAIKTLESIWREQVADKGDGKGNGVFRIRGNPVEYLDLRQPGMPLQPLRNLVDDTATLGKSAITRLAQLVTSKEELAQRMEGLVDLAAFVDITPFCHLIEKNLKPAVQRKSGKVLRVMATGWRTGDTQEFDFPNMTDEETCTAIRASAAIPGLFPPVKLWDETFVDGGVLQNTPIKPAIEEGATEIHVVSLNPTISQFPEHAVDNTLDTFMRVYSAMLAENLSEDIASAGWVNDGIEVMERVEAGEALAEEVLARFVRVADVIYRKLHASGKLPKALTIHRYFPNRVLGNSFGMLNFHESAITTMIDHGYADAIKHNCAENECLIPAAGHRKAEQLAGAAG